MRRISLAKLLARLVPVVLLAVSGVLVSTESAGANPPPPPPPAYHCAGGTIPAGTYHSILVTGVCSVPSGNVVVQGNLTVAPGALLDAVTPGDPVAPATPVVPATVVIWGSVTVGSGGVFLLGCSPNISCSSPPGITYDHIGGNLTGYGALGVVVHSASIGGSVSLAGGGGGTNCNSSPASPGSSPAPAPWSEDPGLDYTPVYSDFEDVTVGGNLSVAGLDSCWLGTMRVQTGGSVSFVHDTLADPDAMEVGSNLIAGNLTCVGNSAGGTPTVQFGDGGGAPNLVGRWASGQCAFNVLQPNPAPEADEGTGIPEHIAVPTSSLRTYDGTRTQSGPSVKTLTLGVTASGDTLLAEVNDVVLSGQGLKGTLTADLTQPLGSTGEAFIATEYPNGSESFTAYENCSSCSFDGQTGSTTLRAYGTISPGGSIAGTFLVTSGGAGNGGLSTLAGYGTFTSRCQPEGTLALVEHLRIT